MSRLPIAIIRLLEPVGALPTGAELEATAIIKAAGLTFYEVGDEIIEASKIEVITCHC